MQYPLPDIDKKTPILIAGPTASGKSDLAVQIARRDGGQVINADAFQIYANWQVLTARPSQDDMAGIAHRLYGHVAWDQSYSVGAWLREITPLLQSDERPIIVGGTGLYFNALTNGLAQIPPIPEPISAAARLAVENSESAAMLDEIDPDTRARIDCQNPRRIQRAWEVQKATGKGLAQWHDETPPPLLPLKKAHAIVLDIPTELLNARIKNRFERMVDLGALQEVQAMAPFWQDDLQSCQAIGAPELMAHIRGELPLEHAIEKATIATRQYAKRQRSWFRARNKAWQWIQPLG